MEGQTERHREAEAWEVTVSDPMLPSPCRLSGLQTATWHPSANCRALLQGEHTGVTKFRALTTMTRTTGPAKLQMRGSWMEIQQKSGFP